MGEGGGSDPLIPMQGSCYFALVGLTKTLSRSLERKQILCPESLMMQGFPGLYIWTLVPLYSPNSSNRCTSVGRPSIRLTRPDCPAARRLIETRLFTAFFTVAFIPIWLLNERNGLAIYD